MMSPWRLAQAPIVMRRQQKPVANIDVATVSTTPIHIVGLVVIDTVDTIRVVYPSPPFWITREEICSHAL
jgi:hypothetical protein